MLPKKYSFLLAAFLIAVFLNRFMETEVLAASEEETEATVETDLLFEEKDRYVPDREYEGPSGKQYRLKQWHLESYSIPERRRTEERTVHYKEVEGKQRLPQTASVLAVDKVTGQKLRKECPLLRIKQEGERWISDFRFTAVFHSYDADYYWLGNKKIPYNSAKPELNGCESELKEEIGVNPKDYRILRAEWKGNSYVDNAGILCRDAEITGEKKVLDCAVTYGGEIVFPEGEGVRCIAVYGGFDSPADGWKRAEEKPLRDSLTADKKKGGIWKITWSKIAVTLSLVLAAGLVIMTFLLVKRVVRKNICKKKRRGGNSVG